MKKYVIILLAFVATFFVSCNNVIEPLDNNSQAPAAEGKTITFSATIDVPQTKASLDGLNIKWSDGDYIGVATDNSATIVAYPVSEISEDGLSCSLQVNAVEGATTYYAVFKGSLGADGDATKEVDADDFSAIAFDTTTKTFSGLTVGNQQVNAGSISSHIWYTSGYPLAMAGKSDGNTLIMKPCLALVKVQIAAESVPTDNFIVSETYTSTSNIDHDFSYSAVRGFNFYQIGASKIYSSGDFTVQIGDDGDLTVVSVDTKEYRQISQSSKLLANTPYYMCLIPGGNVTSFKFDFLGYSDNTGALNWNAVYTMTKSGITSVKPGDFYDLGTLNPLGRKKAKNEATADADDEAAASYVPAITIDGNLSDWNEISASFDNSNNSRIREWRFKSDAQKVYFYLKLRKNRVDGGKTLYIGLDLDNNNSTGGSYGDITGCEAYIKAIPFTNSGEGTTPLPVNGIDNASEVYSKGVGTNSGVINTWSYDDDTNNPLSDNHSNIWIEISVPRNLLGLPAAGNTITVGCSYGWGTTDKVSVTME